MAIIKASPAPYPKNNTEEMNSVLKLLDLLDKRFIKPDLKFLDKIPSTDGLFTVVDDAEIPIGKIDVQVKTLSDANVLTPKFQCELAFLAACEQSSLPVLLIAVNEKSNIAYWRNIDRGFLETIALKIKGDSVAVPFPLENKITKDDKEYISKWTEIAVGHNKKLIEYELMADRIKELEKIVSLINTFPKPIHSISKEYLAKLQTFIDTLNLAYESDYRIVKDLFYSNYWKIGIGYSDFTSDRLSYVLYPIEVGENDLMIREIPYDDTFQMNIIRWVGHNNGNPIINNSNGYAYEIIQKQVLDLIQKHYIKLINDTLAKEHVIKYVDRFYSLFGWNSKRKYSLARLTNKVNNFYPIWYEEYCRYNGIEPVKENLPFDIDFIYRISKENSTVTKRALKRYKQSDYSNINVILIDNFNPDGSYFLNSISFLQYKNVDVLERLYPPYNFKNIPRQRPYFLWELISPQDLTIKVRNIFSRLPSLFDEFILAFFPRLFSKVKFYDKFDRLIINVYHKEGAKIFEEEPTIEKIYLKSLKNLPGSINVFQNGENSPITYRSAFSMFKTGTMIDGEQYQIVSASSGVGRHLMSNYPIQDLLYEILEDRFKNYFEGTIETAANLSKSPT